MNKVYPRLEKRKLRRIQQGKRPFKTPEERTDFSKLFEKYAANSMEMLLDTEGHLNLATDSVLAAPDVIQLFSDEVRSLRFAAADGCLSEFFAKLVEAKAVGKTARYNRVVTPTVKSIADGSLKKVFAA